MGSRRKRVIGVLVLGLLAAGMVSPAVGQGQFQIRCFRSKVASVDPIVNPGGVSAHEHEFFGNLSTGASSTYESMVAAGTNCSALGDTAAYWTPTLFDGEGRRVLADSLLIYYRGNSGTRAFPADLRVISDSFTFGADANARTLTVKFPNCWNGEDLDSVDHRSHMKFVAAGKSCGPGWVKVPAITEVFRYPRDILASFSLSSGAFSTGHADFWNTWQQPILVDLVERCIQAGVKCPRIDG